MIAPGPHDLLDTVVEITREKNCEEFRASLVKTVMELLPAQELAFLRAVPGANPEHLLEEIGACRTHDKSWSWTGHEKVQPREITVAAMRALKELRPVQEMDPAGGGGLMHYIPIAVDKRPPELLVVKVGRNDSGDARLLLAFSELYRNFLSLISDGERDSLTGLLNRKTLETRIRRILEAAIKKRRVPASGSDNERRHDDGEHWVAVIDIDHFKRINDRYGHLYGDEVLLLVARIMQNSFRSEDLLFRYGGEEFVIVLAPAGREAALGALERFRRNVETYRFPQIGQVTVSAGIVRLGAQELPSSAVGHADQALYYAKSHGRNRVCSYEDLVAAQMIGVTETPTDLELF